MTAQEGYFIDNDTYANAAGSLVGNYGLVTSDGVTLTVTAGSDTQYTITSVNGKAGGYAVTYSIQGPGGEIGQTNP